VPSNRRRHYKTGHSRTPRDQGEADSRRCLDEQLSPLILSHSQLACRRGLSGIPHMTLHSRPHVQPWSRCQLAGRQVEEGRMERRDESGSAAGATAPVEVGVKEGKRGASETREGQDNAATALSGLRGPHGPGEDGGLHAGVRHDGGPVQEELESKRGGRNWEGESSWKSGGDEPRFHASRWSGWQARPAPTPCRRRRAVRAAKTGRRNSQEHFLPHPLMVLQFVYIQHQS
jgi:hypothetical protein